MSELLNQEVYFEKNHQEVKQQEVASFFNDENINYYWREGYVYIYIEPYNREITKAYANEILNIIKLMKNDILKYLKTKMFILQISDHHIDGLSETNSSLIFDDSYAYPIYQI